MEDGLNVEGIIRIYEGKKERLLLQKNNLFLHGGRDVLFQALMGEPAKYDYVVVGDGTVSPLKNDEDLQNELFRKQITEMYTSEDSLFIEIYIEPPEANFRWGEVGLVSGGDLTKDSGTLMHRSNINVRKNEGSAVTIVWEVKIR